MDLIDNLFQFYVGIYYKFYLSNTTKLKSKLHVERCDLGERIKSIMMRFLKYVQNICKN